MHMILSDFQYKNPRLVNMTFSERNVDGAIPENLVIQNKFHVGVEKHETKQEARVTLSAVIGDLEVAPFMITVAVAADFEWKELPEESIDSMLQINAPALLLGFLRPIVFSITNVSRYPAYNIPFINFRDNTP